MGRYAGNGVLVRCKFNERLVHNLLVGNTHNEAKQDSRVLD